MKIPTHISSELSCYGVSTSGTPTMPLPWCSDPRIRSKKYLTCRQTLTGDPVQSYNSYWRTLLTAWWKWRIPAVRVAVVTNLYRLAVVFLKKCLNSYAWDMEPPERFDEEGCKRQIWSYVEFNRNNVVGRFGISAVIRCVDSIPLGDPIC